MQVAVGRPGVSEQGGPASHSAVRTKTDPGQASWMLQTQAPLRARLVVEMSETGWAKEAPTA